MQTGTPYDVPYLFNDDMAEVLHYRKLFKAILQRGRTRPFLSNENPLSPICSRSFPGRGSSFYAGPPKDRSLAEDDGFRILRRCQPELLGQQIELMTKELQVLRDATKEQEDEMKKDIETLKAKIERDEKENEALTEEISKLITAFEILTPKVADQGAEISSAIESHRIEAGHLREEIQELRYAAERERATSAQLTNQAQEITETLKEAPKRLENLNQEQEKLKKDIQTLQNSQRNFIGYGGGRLVQGDPRGMRETM